MKIKDLLVLVIILSLFPFQTNLPAISVTPQISLLAQSQQNLPVGSIDANLQQTTYNPPEILRMGEDIFGNTSMILDPLNEYKICPNSLIYESLVEYDSEKDEILPTLAAQWVVTNDSKHWTFFLRNNILFHDGSKFNASAVAFNLERMMLDNNNFLPQLDNNFAFESVEIVNEFQVKIHFSEPYAPFQNLVPYFKIASPNSFNGSNLVSPIGTGPYFVNLDESNSSFLQFYRFDQYHGGLAPFKEIHYYFYPAFSPEYEEAISKHELDFVGFGAYIDSDNDPFWKKIELLNSPYLILGTFNYNRTELTNKNVRKAINYALNNVGLTQIFFEDNRKPMRSLLPEGVLGHDPSIRGYPFNLEKANALLDQEGFVRGEDGIRFSLRLIIPPHAWFHGSYIQDSLNQVGIDCEIVEDPFYTKLLETGDFDIGLMNYFPSDPYVTYQLLHSKSRKNYGGYSNSLMDVLTTLGQSTPVSQEREFYYKLVLQLAQEEIPYLLLQKEIFTFWKSNNTAPYFHFNNNLRFQFNYTSSEQTNHPIKLKIFQSAPATSRSVTNVQVQKESLYFPITDVIITNTNEEPLLVKNIQMDHNLGTFVSQQNEQGKFFLIEVGNPDHKYRFRCYYDLDEIRKMRKDSLMLYEYNETDRTWIELEIVTSNSSLQFIEVDLRGGITLLRLGEILTHITYHFLPFVTIFSIILVIIISITIFNNQKLAKHIKRVYR
ncbi:MAG: ABC transporter substrate-binding protein [Candidatus Hodarchaeales archaeon]